MRLSRRSLLFSGDMVRERVECKTRRASARPRRKSDARSRNSQCFVRVETRVIASDLGDVHPRRRIETTDLLQHCHIVFGTSVAMRVGSLALHAPQALPAPSAAWNDHRQTPRRNLRTGRARLSPLSIKRGRRICARSAPILAIRLKQQRRGCGPAHHLFLQDLAPLSSFFFDSSL